MLSVRTSAVRSSLSRLIAPLLVAIAIAGPALDNLLASSPADVQRLALGVPPNHRGCEAAKTDLIESWPDISGEDRRIQSAFLCDEVLVSIDIAIFVHQGKGKEAVTETNSIVDTNLLSGSQAQFLKTSSGLEVRQYQVDRAAQPGTVWSWYAVDDNPMASASEAKLIEVANAVLLHQPTIGILTVGSWTDHDLVETAPLQDEVAADLWHWYLSRL